MSETHLTHSAVSSQYENYPDHWSEAYDPDVNLDVNEYSERLQAEYCLDRLEQRLTVARLKFVRDTEYAVSPDAYYAGVEERDRLSKDMNLPISAINVLVGCVEQFDV